MNDSTWTDPVLSPQAALRDQNRSRLPIRWAPRVALVTAAVVLASSLVALPAVAAPVRPGSADPASLNSDRLVPGRDAPSRQLPAPDWGPQFEPRTPTWPTAVTAEVELGGAVADPGLGAADIARPARSAAAVRVPGSNVWLDPSGDRHGLAGAAAAAAAPEKVRVHVFDRKTAQRSGIDGTLLRLGRTDGAIEGAEVGLKIDYSAFAGAYGGGWADRLRVVAMPACVLTTPDQAACRQQTPVTFTNDVSRSTINARVSVPAMTDVVAKARPGASPAERADAAGELAAYGPSIAGVSGGLVLALSGGPSGGSGSTAATSLLASAAWGSGSNTGEFTWSYPMRTPPSLGGPSPALNLTYSSGSVDGRTPAENAQPSWIGEGFEFGPGGFIERKYTACAKDMGSGANNATPTGDLCWLTRGSALAENLTMSLGGRGGELIRDATNPNRWHPRNEDGSLVERRVGGSNGDDNGEYWVVTTTDGTQYWFGSKTASNATFTVPVYGNHTGEPCRASTFVASSCVQAYRWNLDHVVDPHDNTMSYTYAKETNSYAAAGDPNSLKSYVRGGYLTAIDYGTRVGGSSNAPMRVEFAVADRCVSNCWSGSNPVTASWSDTPWDQRCTATPCDDFSPSFYTAKRLSQITTRIWNAGGAKYDDVERWTLLHGYPDPQDGTRAGLFLQRIQHSGLVGTTTSVPDVVFVGEAMQNRVIPNAGDGKPSMNWQRVKTITTETGGVISVTYAEPNCGPTSLPNLNALWDNHLRCFPSRWANPDTGQTTTEFFHKYVVSAVSTDDSFGGSTPVMTGYEYVGDPAWHYTDDDGLIADEDKTWSVWRGYPTVRTTVGDPGDPGMAQTQTETTYFRGMHGDKRPSGTHSEVLPAVDMNGDGDTADVNVDAPAVNDDDAFAGMARRSVTLLGPGGAEVGSVVTQPWQSGPTATRTIDGTTVAARFTNTTATYSREALDSDSGSRAAGWRTSSSATAYDQFGMAVSTEDRGDDAVADDQTCRLVEYARDAAVIATPVADKWLMGYPKRVRDFAVDCATATSPTANLTEDDVVADNLTIYDGLAHGIAPTKGDVTENRTMKAWNAQTQTPTYLTLSTGLFDDYGRITQATDVRGNVSTTSYTPATGGPVTGLSVVNHLGWTNSTTFQPAWGEPINTTDQNNRTIKRQYDGLGRLLKVWKADRSIAQPANTVYTYSLRNDGASSVTTAALNPNGGYLTTYQIYDSLLRPRQTQAPNAIGAGRMVTDTFYDSAGRPFLTNNAYWAADPASPNLKERTAQTGVDVPSATKAIFDGVGRVVAGITLSNGNELWRTSTAYTGDRSDTTPPEGGTAYSTVTDTAGRTTQLRTYSAPTPTGAFDSTQYTYNRKGQLTRVSDPVGNNWDFAFDLLGRQVSATDPDKGTTTSTFNDYGDLLTTTDELDQVLAYTYDQFGRQSTMHDGSDTGPKRIEWIYEGLSNSRGMLTKSIRWDGSDAYSMEVTGFTLNYEPTGIKYTIPSTAKYPGINGSFTYYATYKPDGSPSISILPDVDGAGGLPAEQLTMAYNAFGAPTTLSTSIQSTTYVAGTDYTSYGEVDKITLRNNAGLMAYVQFGYDYGTRRLNRIKTSRDTAPTVISDVTYAYDDAGNTTKIKDSAASPTADVQCFRYDHLTRLREAWTPAADDCVSNPSASLLGGPAAYWTSWDIDAIGNRTEQVEHATPLGDRVTSYDYFEPGGVLSHRLKETSTVDASGTTTASYGYDVTGNTVTRPGANVASNQSLEWDVEGHLESVVDGSDSTSFLYGPDGSRLARRDVGGTTLYLPGQELRVANGGIKSTTRYYTHGGVAVAMRTTAGVVWLASDQHGTATVSMQATGGQAEALRRETPYGTIRQATGSWPAAMDKGFVGGTNDPTGLTHLGAREYDPTIGRFISVDPIVDFSDPQQMQGYAYANNSPTSLADATGLKVYDDTNDSYCDKNCQEVNAASDELSKAKKEKAEAEKVKSKSIKDIIIEQGVGFLLDMFGITDIWNCISKGDAGACVNALLGALPVGKIFTMGKAIWKGIDRAFSAYKTWKRAVSAAEAVLSRADEAIELAQSKFDGVLKMFAESKASKKAGKNNTPDAEPPGGTPKTEPPGCHSFDPDTRVLMADGTTEAIEDIEVGDEVVATDPETGQTEDRQVTQVHVNRDTELTELTIKTEDGTVAVLETTQNHPFWNEADQEWVDAGELETGSTLRTADGTTAVVVARQNFTGLKTMRDLTVEVTHTYYVIAGDTPVLVHNCGEYDGLLGDLKAAGRNIDPSDARGEFEKAGRGLAKHAGRATNNGQWPIPSGKQNPAAWNALGRQALDDILDSSRSVEHAYSRKFGHDILEVRGAGGLGARFKSSGGVFEFMGFLD